MGVLDSTSIFQRAVRRVPRLRMVTELAVLTGLLMVVVPMAIAVFPQEVIAPVSSLEPEFHHLNDKQGYPIQTLTYNKGL